MSSLANASRDGSRSNPMFERMALIGIGLIGSSMSHAARRAGVVGEVVGAARTPETVAKALEMGIIDVGFANPADAVKDADLVVLCVPVGVCGKLTEAIAASLKPGAILTDVGSVKEAIWQGCAPHVPEGVHFIPGHPIAGTEQSGPESGFAELFDDRWCILTPPDDADPIEVERLSAFWRALGSHIELMSPRHHDLVLAITSHVPHLIAFNIVSTAAHLERVTDSEVIKFSAGGFRDFTRIAASDPVMWRDVFLNNREAVLEMLARFSEDLTVLQRAIRFGDGDVLFEKFNTSRDLRRGIIDAGQDTAVPDFGRRRAAKDAAKPKPDTD